MPFAGLLAIMIAGAANDNLIKTAFVVAISALSWNLYGLDAVVLANLAALSFIFPFVVLAGFAAHKANQQPPKRWLLILKVTELGLALLACLAIIEELPGLLLFCVAGFGVQSALIGPLKYSLIPRLVTPSQIVEKNAWMETGTFVAILIGTLLAADWIIAAPWLLVVMIVVLALIGCLCIVMMPSLSGYYQSIQKTLPELIHQQRQDHRSMAAIWCLSGFWGLGSVWLTHLPVLAVDVWQLSPSSVSTLLSHFVLGISLGAFAGVFMKRLPLIQRIFIGAIAMVIGGSMVQVNDYQIASIGLMLTSAGGGFLALPLYTLLQDDLMAVAERIAVNNIANALMMIATAMTSLIVVGLLELPLQIWLLLLSIGQFFLCFYHRRNLRLS
jgi:MFS family permease